MTGQLWQLTTAKKAAPKGTAGSEAESNWLEGELAGNLDDAHRGVEA